MEFNSGFKGLIQHLVSSLSVSDRPVNRLRKKEPVRRMKERKLKHVRTKFGDELHIMDLKILLLQPKLYL